jgi:AAA domain
MTISRAQTLPVVRVAGLPSDEIAERWLVEQLWCTNAVGVIGGAPKCAKTWLGLDIDLSVATGTPCLGKYNVPEPGPVLVYLAEDELPAVRKRVEGMARHRGLDLAEVEIHVITASVLRLDREPDRIRLLKTTRRLRPRLLLLDPLVRPHGIDENNASEVAALLAYFRSLQRQFDVSVLLVHHTRKNATGGAAAGLRLRGSSDIHASGDSNLYLRRGKVHLVLSTEHRAAPALPPIHLTLITTNPDTTHLEALAQHGDGSTKQTVDGKSRSLEERVLDNVAGGMVLTRAKLHDCLAVKNKRLGGVLESLERASRLSHTAAGWQRLD